MSYSTIPKKGNTNICVYYKGTSLVLVGKTADAKKMTELPKIEATGEQLKQLIVDTKAELDRIEEALCKYAAKVGPSKYMFQSQGQLLEKVFPGEGDMTLIKWWMGVAVLLATGTIKDDDNNGFLCIMAK